VKKETMQTVTISKHCKVIWPIGKPGPLHICGTDEYGNSECILLTAKDAIELKNLLIKLKWRLKK